MREILFRGKRTSDGEWIEGTMFQLASKLHPFIMLTERYAESYEVDSETVGQYTGLTDKNGKKVFEGDIIAFTCNDGTKHFSVVKYGIFNCSCCYGVYGWYFDGGCGDIRDLDPKEGMISHISIEGNIHDNPELMEKK